MHGNQHAGALGQASSIRIALAGVPSADAPSRWARAYDLILRAVTSTPDYERCPRDKEENHASQSA